MQGKLRGGTLVGYFLLIFCFLTAFSSADTLVSPLRQFGHPEGSAAFSPDGSKLILGRVKARLLDANTGATLHYFGDIIDQVSSVAYSPDGTKIATGGSHYEYPPGTMGTLQIWSPVTGKLINSKKIPSSFMNTLAFSQDGSKILIPLSAAQYQPLLVLDAVTLQQIRLISDSTVGSVKTTSVSREGNRYAVGNQNGTVHIWNVNTGNLEKTILTGSTTLWHIALSHDGQTLLALAIGEPMKLWNTATGAFIRQIGSPDGDLSPFFSHDSSKIIRSVPNNMHLDMHVYDANTGNLIRAFNDWHGIFHPDSDKVLIYFKLYDIASGNLLRDYNNPSVSHVHSVDLSPDQNFLLTA